MKIGLWITGRFGRGVAFEQQFRNMLDQARLARDGGFHILSGGQHFLAPRLQTFPLLARLAAETGEMEIATSVVLLPLLNPVQLAEDAATINAMTGGRFILGVGLGHQADEREAFGIAKEEVTARFDEAMTVMDLVWEGEGKPHRGRYYALPELKRAWPVPYPRPRLWIGGSSDRAFARARAYGLPWFPSEVTLDGLVERYAAHPPAGGPPVADLPVGVWCHVAETDGEAIEEATRLGQVDPSRPDWPVKLMGSPETVVAQIREWERRLAPTHLLLRPEVPGMDQAAAMRRIELLAERVIPALR